MCDSHPNQITFPREKRFYFFLKGHHEVVTKDIELSAKDSGTEKLIQNESLIGRGGMINDLLLRCIHKQCIAYSVVLIFLGARIAQEPFGMFIEHWFPLFVSSAVNRFVGVNFN